jgi:hypothetical protein
LIFLGHTAGADGYRGAIEALDARSGTQRWRFEVDPILDANGHSIRDRRGHSHFQLSGLRVPFLGRSFIWRDIVTGFQRAHRSGWVLVVRQAVAQREPPLMLGVWGRVERVPDDDARHDNRHLSDGVCNPEHPKPRHAGLTPESRPKCQQRQAERGSEAQNGQAQLHPDPKIAESRFNPVSPGIRKFGAAAFN